MRTYLSSIIFGSLIVLTLGAPIGLLAQAKPNDDVLLTDAGQKLQLEYAAELEKLLRETTWAWQKGVVWYCSGGHSGKH